MRPYVITLSLLALALIFSVGLGAVYIAPLEAIRILFSRLPLIHLTPDWQETSETILFNGKV